MRSRWSLRRIALLGLWALGVIFINIVWLRPLIVHIGEKTATDVYYQIDGLRDLAHVLIRPACLPALGLVALAALGVRVVAREGRLSPALPALCGAFALLFAAAFGVRMPGIRHLEPGRFLFTTMVFLAPLAGAGARFLIWNASARLSPAPAGRVRAATIALAIVAMLPLSALESKAFYRHTITTTLPRRVATLFDGLDERLTGPGRLLFEDAPARFYGGGHVGAILPLRTGVEQIGGPYPHTFMVHYFTSFTGDVLLGRPLDEWNDADLRKELAWLGVRWILTATPGAASAFDGRDWVSPEWSSDTYTLWRTGYPLSDRYRCRSAINALDVDVTGTDDVVIPYHWMEGLRAQGQARISPVSRPPDPVPFIRIEPHGASRVRITY